MSSDFRGICTKYHTLAELLVIKAPRRLKQPETSGDEGDDLSMQRFSNHSHHSVDNATSEDEYGGHPCRLP